MSSQTVTSHPEPFGVPWGTMGHLVASLGLIQRDHTPDCPQADGHEGPSLDEAASAAASGPL